MLILLLVFLPLTAGLLTFWLQSPKWSRWILIGAALGHAELTVIAWGTDQNPILGGWFAIDALGKLFLAIASILFLATSFYIVGYLRHEESAEKVDTLEKKAYGNESESIFIGCLLMFLSAMTLVTVSQHFGIIWVGIEATTLASAPLIYFHRHHRSLEAAWKYLLICSVGIAFALLGNFLLAVATTSGDHSPSSMLVSEMVLAPGKLHLEWMKGAFLFFLVGYGTKMGLAPMHSWLPDAYSEAPSAVSALLSGALSNIAFLGLLRSHQVCIAAGVGSFSQNLLMIFGLISMGVAAVFIIRQTDYKRMLAYSSVEHIGILALGVGLGGTGAAAAGLHAVGSSLSKGALFLVAGKILSHYRTKSVSEVVGMSRTLPITAARWVGGFFAITGAPPFSTFLSEFSILKAAIDGGHGFVAFLYLAFLAMIFVGMVNIVLPMVQGTPLAAEPRRGHEAIWSSAPPALLGLIVLILGVYIPSSLQEVLKEIASAIGGTS